MIEAISSQRSLYRERRKKNKSIQLALVGYTNAGKSTLLKQLTKAEAYTEDQLFATLDTLTRVLKLPSGLELLISDTVGFIQDLPTSLIAAFRSTLEEVREADLILHIIDSHHLDHQNQMRVVEQMLEELEAAHLPVLYIFNKRDLPPSEDFVMGQADLYISAHDLEDINKLKAFIEHKVKEQLHLYSFSIPAEKAGQLTSFLRIGILKKQIYVEEHNCYFIDIYLPSHIQPETVWSEEDLNG
jgi:GTP-binding protein HflX